MAVFSSLRRRLPRFHRRTWIALALAIGSIFAYGTWDLAMTVRHHLIAIELRKLGAFVDFDPDHGAAPASKNPVIRAIDPYWRMYLYRRIQHVTLQKTRSPSQAEVASGLDLVKRIGGFKSLSLYETKIEDADLADLISNVQIETLHLSSQSLPRGRIPFLAKPELKWLAVIRSQFSDPAIDDLPVSLTHFNATRTRISDAGLKKFHRLKNLKVLKLNRTQTSRAAIEQLIKEMPQCKISWEPLHQAPNRFDGIN